MVIIVSGSIGVGKTTICRRVIDIAQTQGYKCGGIITYKTENGDIIIKDIQTGKIKILASTRNIYQGPRTAKYFFNPEAIDFGTKCINGSISADITFIDELGYLELQGQGFAKAVEQVAARLFKTSILVIRTELLSSYLLRLGTVTIIFETTLDNRNQLPEEIYQVLQQDIRSGS